MGIQNNLWTYDPLTDEEVKAYWSTLNEDQRIEEIRKLDILEHSIPILNNVNYIAILTDNGNLKIYPEFPQSELTIGYLTFEVTLPEYLMKDFYKPENKDIFDFILSMGLGAISGIIGTAITGEDIWWKYAISGSIGIGIGWIFEYVK